jgi:hypothetical protein
VLGREGVEGQQVGFGVLQQGGDLGGVGCQLLDHLTQPLAGLGGGGGGEGAADRAGDQGCCALVAWPSMSRRKWTVQRCQGQPSTWAIAFFKPWWASEVHSLTPSSPRARSERRNSRQNASVSASPTSRPITSRRPEACTP